jgi:hypothetical protein
VRDLRLAHLTGELPLSGNASGDPTRNSPDIEYLFLTTMNISFKSQ